jgi:hypothetical protein
LPRCGSAWLGKRASADASSSTRASSDSLARASGAVAVVVEGDFPSWVAAFAPVGAAFSCRWPAPCRRRRDR